MSDNVTKPNFNNALSGVNQFKGLERVDPTTKKSTPFKDIDYLELIGRKANKLDEDQQSINPNLPTNYGGMDTDVVKLGKAVCEAIDNQRPRSEIQDYITRSLLIGDNE